MKETYRKQSASILHKLFRFGAVFSSIMVVISLIANIGSQFANKLGIGLDKTTDTSMNESKLLPYQPPSFRIFNDVFVNKASAAIALGVVTIGVS